MDSRLKSMFRLKKYFFEILARCNKTLHRMIVRLGKFSMNHHNIEEVTWKREDEMYEEYLDLP